MVLGVRIKHGPSKRPDGSGRILDELEALGVTAGAIVVDRVEQVIDQPNPALLIGKGKAEALRARCEAASVNVVLVSVDLKPVQQRNLERILERKVVDRTGLVLDIFARRARSQEGKLQVELAQLLYLLPRLAGRGTAFSQLAGGIGTRGPGERKIEYDRRRIRDRIAHLRRQIEGVRSHRTLQRKARQDVPIPIVAIVGYTNAGKSTLLNALTHAKVFTEDLLFSTLDPTTRRFKLPHHGEVLLTDTVGFLEDLSHHVIDAFKATLEEVTEADLLVHAVDASLPAEVMRRQMATVERTIRELMGKVDHARPHAGAGGAGAPSPREPGGFSPLGGPQGFPNSSLRDGADRPSLLLLNKADRLDWAQRRALSAQYPDGIVLSALSGEGMEVLAERIEGCLAERRHEVNVLIPYSAGHTLALVHQYGIILNKEHGPTGVTIRALVDPKFAGRLKQYAVSV